MELLNASQLLAAYTQGLAPDGRESLVVVAKGTFNLPLDGRAATLADTQQPLLMADTFLGEPGLSAPLQEMDFAPVKPCCDVLVRGKAYAPGGRPVTQLTAGIRVGQMSKAFSVLGPRQWQSGLLGVAPGLPQPFTEQDISYARAFGGSHPIANDPQLRHCYLDNPTGCGWYPRSADSADIVGMPMPSTEELGKPIDSPSGNFRPMALGPLGRGWPQRARFAGTYDEAWLADCFPFLPADFDQRYFQAAPDDQQTHYLRGGEDVLLLNLTPQERAGFRIPQMEVPVTFFLKKGGHETVQAVIDTLLIDTDTCQVQLTWRVSRPLQRNLFEIAQVLVGTMSTGWWRARELGKDYYPSLSALVKAKRTPEETP
ncbi:DUF2169 domain-containing protein [Pseudomonas chlororaphis]|uniref:DUF2169 family type VI secretion system accessory protein n=1 Tax=Pseudomonas TaxID=286 RepID=UPI0008D69B17|nr:MULTISPECIES: DUF2169 domain-containing protein [Pseudomonas]AZD16467.1 hypothetical protein C4K25_3540 [Pseudomonas chlororaphis]WDH45105.1 DUF2169 domain-containing protein [Pseudomonas chlororaphis]WDH56951.1 DUF2169 domain-containing protein [Pseudomonas chlororaphis]WQE16210.1 DUF2169 domain-containing protein [Pseudomonas chlororaphis]SEM16392.1 hypothetical protein SAMN03159414_4437 [Pseudomonas sp. NFACC41-3]